MSSVCEISPAEYEAMLRLEFSSFIERSFYELNTQTPFYGADYIDLMASFLEKSRVGKVQTAHSQSPTPRTQVARC